MNKTELVAAVAEQADISKKDAEKALKAFVDVVTEEMKKGEKVQLVGFGTFEVSERAAREGRNPQSEKGCALFVLREGKIKMRLDKFLKVSRLIKRRTVANEACDAGRVLINGAVAKASTKVKKGDIIEIQFGTKTVKAEVLDLRDTTKKEEAADLFRYL